MINKLAIALVSTALLAGPAFAQSNTSKSDTTTTSAAAHKDGYRASKLSGVNVYNDQNEKIGDVSDVILDKSSGKATAVIIGVGGFLGIGEHLVSVPYEKVKWVDEPVRSATATTTSDRPAANSDATRADGTRTTTGTASTTTSRGSNWYPDHAVYSATKEQLKQMPEFKY
jgi:sporulation protein YlmC with PRC-barrel domain